MSDSRSRKGSSKKPSISKSVNSSSREQAAQKQFVARQHEVSSRSVKHTATHLVSSEMGDIQPYHGTGGSSINTTQTNNASYMNQPQPNRPINTMAWSTEQQTNNDPEIQQGESSANEFVLNPMFDTSMNPQEEYSVTYDDQQYNLDTQSHPDEQYVDVIDLADDHPTVSSQRLESETQMASNDRTIIYPGTQSSQGTSLAHQPFPSSLPRVKTAAGVRFDSSAAKRNARSTNQHFAASGRSKSAMEQSLQSYGMTNASSSSSSSSSSTSQSRPQTSRISGSRTMSAKAGYNRTSVSAAGGRPMPPTDKTIVKMQQALPGVATTLGFESMQSRQLQVLKQVLRSGGTGQAAAKLQAVRQQQFMDKLKNTNYQDSGEYGIHNVSSNSRSRAQTAKEKRERLAEQRKKKFGKSVFGAQQNSVSYLKDHTNNLENSGGGAPNVLLAVHKLLSAHRISSQDFSSKTLGKIVQEQQVLDCGFQQLITQAGIHYRDGAGLMELIRERYHDLFRYSVLFCESMQSEREDAKEIAVFLKGRETKFKRLIGQLEKHVDRCTDPRMKIVFSRLKGSYNSLFDIDVAMQHDKVAQLAHEMTADSINQPGTPQHDALSGKADTQDLEVAAVELEMRALQDDLDEANGNVAKLETHVQELNQYVGQLREIINENEDELDRYESEVANLRTTVTEQNMNMVTLEREHISQTQDLNQLRDELAAAREELDRFEAQREEEESQKQKAHEMLEQGDFKRTKEQMLEMVAETTEQDLVNLRKEWDVERSELIQQLIDLRKQIDRTQGRTSSVSHTNINFGKTEKQDRDQERQQMQKEWSIERKVLTSEIHKLRNKRDNGQTTKLHPLANHVSDSMKLLASQGLANTSSFGTGLTSSSSTTDSSNDRSLSASASRDSSSSASSRESAIDKSRYWLSGLIHEVYKEYTTTYSLNEIHLGNSFADFVYDFLMYKYVRKAVADKTVLSLLESIATNRRNDYWIDLFARFLEEETLHPMLVFLLTVQSTLADCHIGLEFPEDTQLKRPKWIDLERAMEVTYCLFPGLKNATAKNLVGMISAKSRTVPRTELDLYGGPGSMQKLAGSRRIAFDQFLKLTIQQFELQFNQDTQYVRDQFKKLDMNKDGTLNLYEFEKLMNEVDRSRSNFQIAEHFTWALAKQQQNLDQLTVSFARSDTEITLNMVQHVLQATGYFNRSTGYVYTPRHTITAEEAKYVFDVLTTHTDILGGYIKEQTRSIRSTSIPNARVMIQTLKLAYARLKLEVTRKVSAARSLYALDKMHQALDTNLRVLQEFTGEFPVEDIAQYTAGKMEIAMRRRDAGAARIISLKEKQTIDNRTRMREMLTSTMVIQRVFRKYLTAHGATENRRQSSILNVVDMKKATEHAQKEEQQKRQELESMEEAEEELPNMIKEQIRERGMTVGALDETDHSLFE